MHAMGIGRSVWIRSGAVVLATVVTGFWLSCATHRGEGDASSHLMGDGATGLDGGGNPSDGATAGDGAISISRRW